MRLKVGLLLDSFTLKAWEWGMVHKIVQSAYADVVLAVVLHTPTELPAHLERGPTGWLRQRIQALVGAAYRYWDGRYACSPDAFAARSANELLQDVPVLHAPLSGGAGSRSLSSADVHSIRCAGLDVLLDLSTRHFAGEISDLARYGLWGLRHGDEARGYGCPAGFWEIFFRAPVTESSLHMLHCGGVERRVLTRTYSATDLTSTRRNNNARYWKAGCLVPRKLKELSDAGKDAFASLLPNEFQRPGATVRPRYGPPTSSELAAFLVGRFTHALRNRAEELLKLPQWILLSKLAEDFPPRLDGFRKILPPKDRFWADPHVIYRDGKYYVFIEEFLFEKQKGHISVLTIDEQGNCAPPVKALERDYHLSYPSMFEAGGTLYMIPESADNKTVELYRCVEFPARWEWVGNLLENIMAFDATLVQHGGRWWLFANVIEDPGISSWDELFLFHSDALFGAEWVPHRLNPIISDVRRARPAGAIVERDGQLYRPSQDCSVRYGYAIRINRITKLSEDDYEESEVLAIPPEGLGDVVAAHTYARAERLTVLDALRPRWRF